MVETSIQRVIFKIMINNVTIKISKTALETLLVLVYQQH